MPRKKSLESPLNSNPLPPAYSMEDREDQLIAAACNLVEKRLLDGSASAQEVCHFLKLATRRERLEREILKTRNELLEAQRKAIESAEEREESAKEVIEALKRYRGNTESDEDYEDLSGTNKFSNF